ncbi:MAG TPA: phosphoribosyltransferase family protein [Patescibacteria group bacterium]|nr:phosphoribosyltransferase family protein [Patescibacteria group bacterium]
MTARATATIPLSVTHSYTDPATGQITTLTFDEFIPEHVVRARVRAMAKYLAPLLAAHPDETVVVPVLAGGSQIMDAILREAEALVAGIAPRIAPVKVRSYEGTAAGKLCVDQDVPAGTFAGKTVFVFDEVVDRGHTMRYLLNDRIKPEHPKAIIVVTLVRKLAAHEVDVQTDVVGFDTPPDFLLGWGMDWHQRGRWQPWIGRLRDDKQAIYTVPKFPNKNTIKNVK